MLDMRDVNKTNIPVKGIENFGARRDDDAVNNHELTIRYPRKSIILKYADHNEMFIDAGRIAKAMSL